MVMQVAQEDADAFCSHRLLDGVPVIFDNRRDYIDWKAELGGSLKVDPHGVIIVGSSSTGISLNPKNDLRPFDIKSDIDVAVISAYHFDLAWARLRAIASSQAANLSTSRRERKAVEAHRQGLLFDGCIATNEFLRLLEFGPDWSDALGRQQSSDATIGHALKTRIYRDYAALREYQLKSIRTAKRRIVALLEGSAQ